MATVRVSHGIGDLARDCAAIPGRMTVEATGVVSKNVRAGCAVARREAMNLAGPHGKNYFKRITSEMLTPLSGEFGPNEGGTPVGGGWRHGVPNAELSRAQDAIGPKFARDAGEMLGGLFW